MQQPIVLRLVKNDLKRSTTVNSFGEVRPAAVLAEALARAEARWAAEGRGAWSALGEELRSMRQDLSVQDIRDSLAVGRAR